ncbi:MAG: CPBP family intramembrane glutamic endopeptidase [Steroidobacteraceae bacterium]
MSDAARSVLVRTLGGSILMVAGSAVVNGIVRLNEWANSETVWFPVPLLAFAAISVWVAHSKQSETRSILEAVWISWRWILSAALFVALLGLGLTGIDQIVRGAATLVGDLYSAPPHFRTICSLSIGAASGLVEESIVRGYIQLPLEKLIRPAFSQGIAAAVFVGVHALTGVSSGQLVFLLLLAYIAGVFASRFRTPVPAAAMHAISNLVISIVVLGMRP